MPPAYDYLFRAGAVPVRCGGAVVTVALLWLCRVGVPPDVVSDKPGSLLHVPELAEEPVGRPSTACAAPLRLYGGPSGLSAVYGSAGAIYGQCQLVNTG